VTKPRLEWLLTVHVGLISDQWCNSLHCLHQSHAGHKSKF